MAREDFEPFARMAGGLVSDALEETALPVAAKPDTAVMTKCRSCGKLNAEDAKFCEQCGKAI
jgi:uncharacterized OB-fold protein